MIECITKIPLDVLKGQLENVKVNEKEKFMIIFLDPDFNIESIEEGTYSEICEKHNLSDLQKELINKFNYYRGIVDFPGTFNRYSLGGKQALASCSALHFDFSKGGKTSDKLKNHDFSIVNKIIDSVNDSSENRSFLFKECEELPRLIEHALKQVFTKDQLNTHNFFEYKIVLMPKTDSHIIKYNRFHQKYIDIKKGKKEGIQNVIFNMDAFNVKLDDSKSQTGELGILYSKFSSIKSTKITFQTEHFNLIPIESYEKIDLFKKIIKTVLPLPNFDIHGKNNIYLKCFSENGLLEKLKGIYEENNNKPYNYILVTNFDGYRFETVSNFDFFIDNIINKNIYDLDFNKYVEKKEEKEINNSKKIHDKYELLFDIAKLFWNLKDEEAAKKVQLSFFTPSIKSNSFVNQILQENSENITALIFKQKNNFLNYRLKSVVLKILNRLFCVDDLRKMYGYTLNGRQLLLCYYKYTKDTCGDIKMAEIIKQIENKLNKFQQSDIYSDVENDIEGYYLAGQIIDYILSLTASSKNKLELMSKYLISVNNVHQLKNKICELSGKYSHEIYEGKKWNKINEQFLKYEFKDSIIRNNLISLFTGFYADNIFFGKSNKNNNRGGDDHGNN